MIVEREQERPILTPQDFIDLIASRTEVWLEEDKEAEIVAEFSDESVSEWNHISDQHGINAFPVGVDVVRAALLRDGKFNYAVALTHRVPFHTASRVPTFEFGLVPHEGAVPDPSIEYVRSLVHQEEPWTRGSGMFYVNPVLNRVRVDCWADSKVYGGDGINSWPADKVLSLYGLGAAQALIQRVAQHAFETV